MCYIQLYFFMKITIISTNHKLPNWINEGIKDFTSRLTNWQIHVIELKPSLKLSAIERMQIEAKNIEKNLQNLNKSILICLDEKGKSLTTCEFSQKIDLWQQQFSNICFVIGGADGIYSELKQKASFLLQLSPMTLPHSFAKLILTEQIYRVWSILNNHPYHRV